MAAALAVVLTAVAPARLPGQEDPEPGEPPLSRECPAGETELFGSVRDVGTGLPLPGARVHAAPVAPGDTGAALGEVAGPDGSFRLCGVPAGPVVLVADFQGTPSAPDTSTMVPERPIERDIRIDLGRPGSLEGRILAGEVREPVPGALVTLEPLGLQALTDSAGSFALEPVPPASYGIAVHHPRGIRVDSLEVRPGSRIRFESRLTAREVVLGSAWRGFGAPGDPARGGADRAGEATPPERAPDAPRAGEEAAREGPAAKAARVVGALLDAPLLRRWKADRLGQALTLIPGVELVRRCAGALASACGFLPRLSADPDCGEAPIYVDGRILPVGPAGRALDRLSLEGVAAVQVVAAGASLPESIGEGLTECGAVLVWTESPGGDDPRDRTP